MTPVCMVCMHPKVETNPDAEVPHQRWSCQSDICRKYAEMPDRPVQVSYPDVPGAHNESRRSSQYKFQKEFGPGLDAYAKARKEGLRPGKTTVGAVRKAQEDVRSQKRALKKLSKVADVSELKTLPGVN